MSQAPSTYTEVLAPAVYTGIESAKTSGLRADTSFMARANAVAASTLAMLDNVDWDSTGLPDRETMLDGERVTLGPKAYAQHLTVEAFQDAIVLMDLCIGSAQEKVSPVRRLARAVLGKRFSDDPAGEPMDMLAVLTDSKQTVLNRVLGLTDHGKFALLEAVKTPSLAQMYLGFRQVGPAVRLVESDGDTPKLAWSKGFDDWIKANTEPGRGCPARNFVIDTDQGRQPVTHYLWDQLVALRFPERMSEPAAQALGAVALAS